MLKILLFFAAVAIAGAAPAGPPQPRYVLIFSRHGVRPPTKSNDQLRKYADRPWPEWAVAPGLLTPHGRKLMVQMGRYYKERYGVTDSTPMYFASDDMERTHETARALSEGLTGTVQNAVVLDSGWTDPGSSHGTTKKKSKAGDADIAEALRNRIGSNPASLEHAYHRSLVELTKVLGGPAGWIDEPLRLEGTKWTGPLGTGSSLVGDFVLEYADGQPEVAWGRLTREQLGHLYVMHTTYFDLNEGTLAAARHLCGFLAHRIQASLVQASTGERTAAAFGQPDTRLAVVVGHDGNICSLGSLFGLSWTVDDLPMSPMLPGGALVFELWRTSAGDRVHVYYIAQTMDQMRSAAVPTIAHPPAIADMGLRPLTIAD